MQQISKGLSPYIEGAIIEESEDQASVGHAGAGGGRYNGENQDASFGARSSVMRTYADAKRLLWDSIAKAADGLKKETGYEEGGGTTATVAAFTPDDKFLTIAQAGDSPVFVVFQNKETGAAEIIDLTLDHSAAGEQARIEAAGGEVIEGRANGILAVSRSITLGNTDYGPGVISSPEINKVDLKQYPQFTDGKHRALLVIGSDGMTQFSTPGEIAAGFQPGQSAPDIAKGIISGAIEKALGTGKDKDWFDNLTANVTELKPDSTEALIAGVMDGHGKNGGVASTILRARLEKDLAAPAAMAAESELGSGFQAASTESDPGFNPRRSVLGSIFGIAKAIISGVIKKALGAGKDKDRLDNLTADAVELNSDSTEALIAGVMDGHGKNGGVASTMLPARLERDSAAPASMAAESGLGLDFQAASTEPDPGFNPLVLIFQGGFQDQAVAGAEDGRWRQCKRLNIAALQEGQIRAVEDTLRILGFDPKRETDVCGGQYIVLSGGQHGRFDAMTSRYRPSDYPEAGVDQHVPVYDDAYRREQIISREAWTQGHDKEENPLLYAKIESNGCVLLASLHAAGLEYGVSRSADGALCVSVSGEGMRELERIVSARPASGIDNLRHSQPQAQGMSPA